jgi:hypothetical protein
MRRTSAFGSRVRSACHGGLTPPAHDARCQFAGENDCHGAHRTSLRKTTFALHKRTFARAAGVSQPWQAKRDYDGGASLTRKRTPSSTAIVSPPWFSEPHLEVQYAEFRRCELVCGVCSTGGLRPPLQVARRLFAVKSGICDEQSHVYKSGGREPAVVRRTASAGAMRRTSAFGSRVRSALHGGLTPPALGAGTTSIRSKKTVFAKNNRTFSRAAGVSPPWELLTPVQ